MPDIEKQIRREVTEEAVEGTMQTPAVYINRFTVAVGEVVRITFIEQRVLGGPEHPRASIVLSHQNAITLYKLLQDMMKPTEEQISKVTKGGGEEVPKNG